MVLWALFAVISVAVALPLMRSVSGRATPPSGSEADIAVYRDQLAELDAEAARGQIAPDEAANARTEIARRVLQAAKPASPSRQLPGLWATLGALVPALHRDNWMPARTPVPQPARSSALHRAQAAASSSRILTVAAVCIPLLSLALYTRFGSPDLPDRPLAARLKVPIDKATPSDMLAQVETRLREHPEDGQGWLVIAPVYLAQGRAIEAAEAYGHALKLLGESPERLAGFAKASVLAGNGIVSGPARAAYERLLVLDPGRVDAQYWLAVSEEQTGHPGIAANLYRRMLTDAPADAPWRSTVQDRLAAVEAGPATPEPGAAPPKADAPATSNGPVVALAPATSGGTSPGSASAGAASGPDKRSHPTPSEFVAAAKGMPPDLREMMIGGKMIPKAMDAVKLNPKDVAAWSRIVTGQVALGHKDEAQAVLARARSASAGETSALAELDALAKDLDLFP